MVVKHRTLVLTIVSYVFYSTGFLHKDIHLWITTMSIGYSRPESKKNSIQKYVNVDETKNHVKNKKISNQDLEKKIILDDLVFKFNMIVKGMISHVTEYYGDSNMAGMELILSDIIEKSPDEPISCFLMNIYKNDSYRTNILKQNDIFFMNENYDDIVGGDDESTAKLFEFKDLWQQVDEDTKKFIKKSMMALVKICQKYVLSL